MIRLDDTLNIDYALNDIELDDAMNYIGIDSDLFLIYLLY